MDSSLVVEIVKVLHIEDIGKNQKPKKNLVTEKGHIREEIKKYIKNFY
jgi:hypothetical protein